MQAFMLYMSGGGVQIFSMGIVAMLLLSPFKNVSSINDGALSIYQPTPFFPSFSCSCIIFFGFMLLCAVIAVAISNRRRIMSLSLCAVCAWPVVVARRQVAVRASAAEGGVPGLQCPHPRARSLEVSVHGLTPNGHWRLAGVRDAWACPRDFALLDSTVLYSDVISPLHTHRGNASLSSYATLIRLFSMRLPEQPRLLVYERYATENRS
jgi:hypothetical protein